MIPVIRGAALATSVLVSLTILGAVAGLYELTRVQSWSAVAVSVMAFAVVVLTGRIRHTGRRDQR